MDDLFHNDNNSSSADYTELLRNIVYRSKVVLKRYCWVVPSVIALGGAIKVVQVYFKDLSQVLEGNLASPKAIKEIAYNDLDCLDASQPGYYYRYSEYYNDPKQNKGNASAASST